MRDEELDPYLQHIDQVVTQNGDYDGYVKKVVELGRSFEAQGRGPQAQLCYQAVLRLEDRVFDKPEQQQLVRRLVSQAKPGIFQRIGEIHQRAGKLELAIAYLKKSADISPGVWQTHMALGRAWAVKGDYKEAIGAFQEVIRLSPEQAPGAQVMLAEVFVRMSRPVKGILSCLQASAAGYLKMGRRAEAEKVLQRMISLDSTHELTQKVRTQLEG